MSGFELRFTWVDSGWAAFALLLLAAVASLLVYWRPLREKPSFVVVTLIALRFGALAVALLFLLRPILRYEVTERRDERLVVLVDRSSSMAVADSVGGETRIESAHRVLRSEALGELADAFHVELRSFAGPGESEALAPLEYMTPVRVRAEDGADETAEPPRGPRLDADGSTTDIAGSWADLTTSAGPIAAVLLVTDGRDHGPLGEARSSTGRAKMRLPPAPIWAIGLGSGEVEPIDLSWTKVSAPRRVLQGSRVRVRAAVTARGAEQIAADLVVRLGSDEVERRSVRLKRGPNELELALVPRRAGRLVYELAVELESGEACTENNRTWLVLDVTDRPIQVLYFEGSARWQYKFARRGMARDPAVNVTGLVALSGGKWLQQGQAPVDLQQGLPRSREDWRVFDVLVLGNVGTGDLGAEAAARIVDWLGKDGGGLVLPGGAESQRSLRASPLGEVLPVAPGDGSRVEGPLALVPAPASLEHPILRGLLGYFAAGSDGDPVRLEDVFRVGPVRPGVELLLTAARSDDTLDSGRRGVPLLATRQYGEGRVVAWLTESDWRWVMGASGDGKDARRFELLWGRMVRWAARRGAAPAEASGLELSRREVRVGEEVVVEARSDAKPKSAAVRVVDPSGASSDLAVRADAGRPRARFRPTRPGVHRVAWAGRNAADEGNGEVVLIVHPDAREHEDTRPDWDFLRELAAESGGRFLTLADASTLVEEMQREHPDLVTHVELGHTERSWWLWALFVALVGLEWGLRRRVWLV